MKEQLGQLLKLQQSNAVWECTLRRAPVWITPKNRAPYRPFVLMIVDQDTEMILNTKIEDERLSHEEILQILVKTMRGTLYTMGLRARPKRILVDNAELANMLKPHLSDLKIYCAYQPILSTTDSALLELEEGINRRKPIPGLLSVPGVTELFVKSYYATSAKFYRQGIWRWMENWDPIEVNFPPDGPSHFALILGIGGDTFGLVLFHSDHDLNIFFSDISQDEKTSRSSFVSLIFDDATGMPFADLDAIERYQWQVAGPDAYPSIIKTRKKKEPGKLPTYAELKELLAVVAVLPDFVISQIHASEGVPQAADVIYTLSGILEGHKIALRYPIDDLSER